MSHALLPPFEGVEDDRKKPVRQGGNCLQPAGRVRSPARAGLWSVYWVSDRSIPTVGDSIEPRSPIPQGKVVPDPDLLAGASTGRGDASPQTPDGLPEASSFPLSLSTAQILRLWRIWGHYRAASLPSHPFRPRVPRGPEATQQKPARRRAVYLRNSRCDLEPWKMLDWFGKLVVSSLRSPLRHQENQWRKSP